VVSYARFSGLLQASGYNSGVVVAASGVTFRHSVFTGGGSGIVLEVAGGASLTVEDSLFEDVATGLLVSSGTATVRGCQFQEAGGAALKFAGLAATGLVQETIFRNNTTAVAITGGASASLDHLTIFADGAAVDLREVGEGSGSGTLVAHSLIAWQVSAAVKEDAGSSADITFSDLAGAGTWPGEGNINLDPRFLDSSAGDFRLSYFSPSRGTGKEDTDMGAIPYEPTGEVGTFLRCDSNGDGDNDISDAVHTLLFLYEGGSAPACTSANDCDGNGEVEMTDVIFDLQHLFLAGASPPAPYPDCEALPVEQCALLTCQ
jgi:hypothetical protein